MADLSITISNQLYCVAPQEPNEWETLVWGTDEWRSSRDTYIDVSKWLAESITLTDQIPGFSVDKWLAESLVLTDSVSKDFVSAWDSGTVTLTSGIDFVSLKQGIWTYVLIGETDPDDRNIVDWTEASAQTDNWTEDTDPTTPWT